jgi:predicted RNA binding protein YcfA (HicA-like mRNA interferase family)
MCEKKLETCRTGKEFISYAEHRGAEIRNGKGSHFIISTERGQAVVPVHPGDLGKGLRCKILKMFTLIGLAMLPMACLIAALISQ